MLTPIYLAKYEGWGTYYHKFGQNTKIFKIIMYKIYGKYM